MNTSPIGNAFEQLADYSRWKEIDGMKNRLEVERSLIAKTMASLVKNKV